MLRAAAARSHVLTSRSVPGGTARREHTPPAPPGHVCAEELPSTALPARQLAAECLSCISQHGDACYHEPICIFSSRFASFTLLPAVRGALFFFFSLRSFCCSSSSSGIFSELSSGPDPFHVSGSWEQNVCASNNKKPSQITCLALQTPLPSSTASPCARLGAWHEKPHLPHLSTQKHLLSTFLSVLPKIYDLQCFLPA